MRPLHIDIYSKIVYNIGIKISEYTMRLSVRQITQKILSKENNTLKITLSSPADTHTEYKKTVLRPIMLKNEPFWQAEQFKDNKVFHKNIPQNEICGFIEKTIPYYGQICVFSADETATYIPFKDGMYREKISKSNISVQNTDLQNNRQKEYILKEGQNIPALVDLGVFTKDFKVVNSKYDKYKQINRFVELIDDAYSQYKGESITILDFGCGKSYLTFIVYYYFAYIKKVDAKIIGYDLKADVVENCNKIAEKYGYDNLKFVVSDVTKDVLYDEKIDMIISLHACDTATDYALFYAIQKGVKNIFSVPCCQHEINSSIRKGGELDVFLKYGIIKERMSVLLTDTVRGMILEDMGYSVDMIEFVDLAHSPKNIMIRAKKTKGISHKNIDNVAEIIGRYHIKQTLYELVLKNELISAASDRKIKENK